MARFRLIGTSISLIANKMPSANRAMGDYSKERDNKYVPHTATSASPTHRVMIFSLDEVFATASKPQS